MCMFLRIINAFGRLLWAVIEPIVTGVGRGLGRTAEHAAPWVIGALLLWGLVVFAPGVLNAIIQMGVISAIMILGFRLLFKAFIPPKKKKEKT